jgi:outer membrane protein
MQMKNLITIVLAAAPMAWALCGTAHADDLENNAVRVGYAKVRFDVRSGDLTGPPGTTPPGLTIGARDLDIFAISYERRLSTNLVAQLQAGIPPTLTAIGAGAAAPIGSVARARIWFPTAMLQYSFPDYAGFRPHLGLGVTYTFFTAQEVTPGYTAALQGSSSAIDLKSSWGAYARLGIEYPIDKRWNICMEYSGFRLKTSATVVTQTPGVGAIARGIELSDTPKIFGLTLGYTF